MRKKRLWAGIDLGVETANICIVDGNGFVVHEASCPSAARDVRKELSNFRRNLFESVALEAGMAPHVARGLRSFGYPIELFEVRQLSKFLRIRRNKTDAGDAHGIAQAARIGSAVVPRVYLKTLEAQALQSRLAVRKHLIAQRVAAVSLLCRQLELFGGRLRCRAQRLGFRSTAEKQIQSLFGKGSTELVKQLRFLAEHCERLMQYQSIIDRELNQVARTNDVCRRLMEIPGVGPLCALSFYAAVDDPHRFSNNAAIGSYFGLAPLVHESGLTSRKGRISKMGSKSVRSLLVHAAGLYMRYAPPECRIRNWTMRIEERRGRLPSRVALARKLATVMLAIWKTGEHFQPTRLVMVGGELGSIQSMGA